MLTNGRRHRCFLLPCFNGVKLLATAGAQFAREATMRVCLRPVSYSMKSLPAAALC
jgi:hypothetical protein